MSVLRQLRSLMPDRPLGHDEARWVAEKQAYRLRELTGTADEPFLPIDVVAGLPKLQLVYDEELPQSGASHWNGRVWQITVNATESFPRQRYTACHELKHVIDYPFDGFCYPKLMAQAADDRAEHYCDLFAAFVLMPKTLVIKAWTAGRSNQDPQELARMFGVSPKAMEIRLQQLGLVEPRHRCIPSRSRPSGSRRTYHRGLPVIGRPRVGMVPSLVGGAL
jgi:Zn-dependent peptidase ImmA (M78 family)